MDVYLKILNGFINDENKLVTYKWLSSQLEVHVNVAKQILENYWNNHKKDELVATVMVIGYLNTDEMRVELIKVSNLKDALKKYDKIISQHIYSLQKTLSDIELLAGVSKGEIKHGAIYCEKSVLLDDRELFARRWGLSEDLQQLPVETVVSSKVPNGGKKFLKESPKDEKVVENSAKNKPEKKLEMKETSASTVKISPKKNANPKKSTQSQKTAFANLFKSKTSVTKQKNSPPSDIVNDETSMEVNDMPKNENIDDTNSCIKETMNKPTTELSGEKSSSNIESQKNSIKSTPTDEKLIEIKESNLKNKKKMNRGMKRNRSQDSKILSQKKKRILVISDSSEESAGSDNEMVCDVLPEKVDLVEEKPPSPPAIQNINGKRKIRKLVDKTFMDEDGYLVTKKEYVYESCSEEEDPPKVLEPTKIIGTSAKPLKKPTKQTTLMNYFKKA